MIWPSCTALPPTSLIANLIILSFLHRDLFSHTQVFLLRYSKCMESHPVSLLLLEIPLLK